MPDRCFIDDALISAWLEDQGLGGQPFHRLDDTGFVNWVYAVGDDLILRVNKLEVIDEDAYTEAVAVPVVVAAGIRTPRLLQFDTSKSTLPSITSLYERAPGVTLGRTRVDQRELPSLYRELGREIGHLHTRVTECPDPNGWLDRAEVFDARKELDRARAAMKVEAVTYDWLAAWLDIVEPAFSVEPPRVFLHNDLHSFNTMVSQEPLSLTAILDWGDAAWGDPMLDFETMPIWAVDWLLEGYREAGAEVHDTFRGRLLWHDIGAALDATTEPWIETSEPWQPLTTSRWVNLTRLMAGSKCDDWKRWMPETN